MCGMVRTFIKVNINNFPNHCYTPLVYWYQKSMFAAEALLKKIKMINDQTIKTVKAVKLYSKKKPKLPVTLGN